MRDVVVVSLISAGICSVLMTLSNRGISRRIRELHRSIAEGDDHRRPPRGADLQRLVEDIDASHDRLRREIEEKNRELLRKERVAGIGLLAADVAHELRNPLNAMLGLTELSLRSVARDGLDDPRSAELHDSLSVVRREAVRCRDVVDRLMAMVRDHGRPTRFEASSLLAETVEVARAARPDRASCFVLRGAGVIEAVAPVHAVRQVMLTLLINAADAIDEDGRIEVDATATGDEVWLRVRDDGCGFDPERPPDRSVPFETTRAEQGGTGLGLSIAQSIASSIGGEVRASSDGPGRGSLFTLALPVATGDDAA
jgi:signal transduction histidine kinase